MIKDIMTANESIAPNSREMEILKEHFPACFHSDGIGVYGQRRRVYLKVHHRMLYYNLLTAGTLDGHLADIEEQAQELFLRLVKQYADTEGVTATPTWITSLKSPRHRRWRQGLLYRRVATSEVVGGRAKPKIRREKQKSALITYS